MALAVLARALRPPSPPGWPHASPSCGRVPAHPGPSWGGRIASGPFPLAGGGGGPCGVVAPCGA